ncbi:MAG TPA: phosphatase PAP2 family protein [Kofleriaceae bacterium]|nr:phosphatase PAP2 family protein [Kofleriaceae bacterium]
MIDPDRHRHVVRVGALVLLLSCAAPRAHAEPASATLDYDWKVDGAITLVGALAFATTDTVLKDDLASTTCRWCDGGATLHLNAVDAGVRDALRWHDLDAASQASSVTGFVLVPTVALGVTALAARHDGRSDEWAPDALVILESTVLAVDLNQVVKFAVARERPLIHDGRAYPANDANTSFYSGHTKLAFALAVSAGTVSTLRGYRWAPAVWTSGLVLAGATGYLRIAGDRHYFTDVMTGAVVGSAVGFAVPYFFHRVKRSGGPTASADRGAVTVGWSRAW